MKLSGIKIHTVGDYHVFSDIQTDENRLVICGGGYVGASVLALGKFLGFHVTVIEDREEFAKSAKDHGADMVYCESFASALDQMVSNLSTYFVVVTRGHSFDADCVAKVLQKPHAYLGMMGSKRKVASIKQKLLADGFSEDEFNSVYAPIGMEINSETPEEVAVSIFAQIIALKNEHSGSSGYSTEILEVIRSMPGKKIIATIISRKGCAPRDPGVKMLLLEDGRTYGTVGGGSLELHVTKKAKELLAGEKKFEICTFNTMGKNVDPAKSCGAIIDILFERV